MSMNQQIIFNAFAAAAVCATQNTPVASIIRFLIALSRSFANNELEVSLVAQW